MGVRAERKRQSRERILEVAPPSVHDARDAVIESNTKER